MSKAPSRSAPIHRPRRSSVRDLVHASLREAIVTGRSAPGAAISENDTAAEFGVSRTPVREALIRLADDGLVEVFPQLGTFVAPIRVAEVREAQFIREALERAALPIAIGRVTDADLDQLDANLDEQRAAIATGDLARFYAADEALHRALIERSGHPKAWVVAHGSRAHLDRVRWLSLPEPSTLGALLEQHTAIVEGVRARDPGRADAALVPHVRLVLDHLTSLRDAHPGFFDDADG